MDERERKHDLRPVQRCRHVAAVAIFAVAPFCAIAQSDPHAGHENAEAVMQSLFGPYPMTREGSGTAWQPDASPMQGVMGMRGTWSWMAHGFANLVYDHQSGPRGDDDSLVQSMFMLSAQQPAAGGTLGFRAMLSIDPATMGKRGYPLLFQTGETADGRTPLVDRQHPHDFFMELSGAYSRPLGKDAALSAYFGLPGEPALGPSAFMHRFSGMRNPEAPLTHHWLDSTHISFGVMTLGASKGAVKLEGSWFNGREPDENRWNLERRRFDSWSTRLSYNPDPHWSAQVSYGDLESPELLEPDTRIKRLTASATYHRKARNDQWQTTLAWGRNQKESPGEERRLPGWLLESTYVMSNMHVLFGRYEQVKNDELFSSGHALADNIVPVRKLSIGYIYDLTNTGPIRWGIGGVVAGYDVPGDMKRYYGGSPRSFMLFLNGRL